MHIGDALFHHVEFKRFVDFILEKENRFVVINGDIINNNLICSVGSPYDDLISPNDQKKEAKRMLMPLRERILCLNGGNHEERTKRKAGQDISEEIAESLGVAYNEDENFLRLSIGKRDNLKPYVYTIYITHGAGGGKLPGSTLNNIEALSKNILADVYIVGHSHRRIGHKSIFRYPDLRNNKIIEMTQLYVAAAGWLTYGGYPVRKMLRQQVRGSHPITLWGNRKEVTTTL